MDNFTGAMENWGLVTYRETCLLVDPEITSTQRKQWIALYVAHEVAHQWFGNLVTMVFDLHHIYLFLLPSCILSCSIPYPKIFDFC